LFAHGPVVLALQRITTGALLVFLVAWGIRARPQTSSLESTPGSAAAFALLFVVGAVTVVVIVGVLRIRVRRRRDGDPEETLEPLQFTVWERIAGLLVAAVVLTIPLVAIWGLSRLGNQPHAGPSPVTPTHRRPRPGHPSSNATGSQVPDWVPVLAGVGLLVLVLAVGLAVVVWRRRAPRPESETVLPAKVVAQVQPPTVFDERDPRRGIIAAYRAFEREAAARGVPTEPLRTAGEIAHHQITSRLTRPNTVAALTGLFHRARYSSEPVGEADREYAERLLARLRAELSRSP
jgi:hypothetical protein